VPYPPEKRFHLASAFVRIEHLQRAFAPENVCRAPQPNADLLPASEGFLCFSQHAGNPNETVGLLRRERPSFRRFANVFRGRTIRSNPAKVNLPESRTNSTVPTGRPRRTSLTSPMSPSA
jgi:hypothetical protein